MERNRIILKGDYHTHTIYSSGGAPSKRHAKGTIRENVEAAYKLGLKEIAITDHGPGHKFYGLDLNNLEFIKEEIKKLNFEYNDKGLKVLFGIEANLISMEGDLDINDRLLNELDFLIMGYHYGAKLKTFNDFKELYIKNTISNVTGLGKEKIIEANTKAYLKAMDKYPIDMISHPGAKAPIIIEEIGKKAIEKNIILEISGKHNNLSIDDLNKLKNENVKYMVNSDAHRPEYIGNIEKALDRALKANIDLEKIVNIEMLGGKDVQ